MDLDKILAITVSGVRFEEQQEVKEVLVQCGLVVEDITPEKLRYFLVARKGDEIIGTIGLEFFDTNGLLRSLVVLEPFRGQGIGKMLLASAEKSARYFAIKRLWLLTTTAADFFKHMGFDTVARADAPPTVSASSEFKRLCPDSAVCMCKTIAGES